MKQAASRWSDIPVSVFVIVPSLVGTALAAMRAARLWNHPAWIWQVSLVLATLIFFALAALYLVKSLRRQDAVADELCDPQAVALASGFSIGLLLLAQAVADIHSETARTLWVAGVVIHSLLMLLSFSLWLRGNIAIEKLTPIWFMPAVGNVLVPIAGVQFYPPEVMWFFFGTGVLLWLALFPLVLCRLVFRPPLPDRLAFAVFILIAPPAAAFLGYTHLTGFIDVFARVLFYSALFLTLTVLLRSAWLPRHAFTSGWWAIGFPLAAMTLATMRYFEMSRWPFQGSLALVLLTLLVAVVSALVVLTIRAIGRNEFPD